ncbi:hypothetical protein EI94DRAFT_1708111 [Lactarius quietus]|nr:hypothetical protein EI94DRAFT_1708111 [Lactarius quietus]
MCLSLLSAKKVHDIIELSFEEQSLTVYGELLRLGDHINIIQPVDAVFRISELLEKKFEEHIFKVLLCNNLPFYVKKKEDVTAIVQKLFVDHPEWGLTLKIYKNKTQLDAIICQILEQANDCCSDINKAIFQSMYEPSKNAEPTQHIQLKRLQTISELCKSLMEIYPHANRHIYQEDSGKNSGWHLWNKVDNDLALICEACRNDRKAISHAIQRILKCGCTLYGPCDLTLFINKSQAGGMTSP